MGRMGNTYGSQSVGVGHARKVWREVKDQFPAGGVVANLNDWLESGKGKIPAGTFCKWEDAGADGGKKVTCYTKEQITSAADAKTLGINGGTLYDIDIEAGDTIATATVIYAGEIYSYMVDADVLAKVKDLAALSEIKFVS